MAEYQNPCGGKRWKLLPGGLIDVEGEGAPTLLPDSSSYKLMLQTWQNWGGALSRASSRYGVPTSWLLAVATMETGYLSSDPKKQALAVSPAGARGVMQILPFNAKPFGLSDEDELFDPEKNIDVGAKILAQHNQKVNAGGLPGISAMYNSGRLCTTDPNRNEWLLLADANYPRRVIEWNNAALESGLVTSMTGSTLAVLGAATGAAIAMAIAGSLR